MKITKRLKKICDKIPRNKTVCDVGTDHGLIPFYLIQNQICKKVIALDVREGICNRLTEKIKREGLTEQIEVFCSDGFSKIRDCLKTIDVIVISGLGGLLMIDILKREEKRIKNQLLILQPQNNIPAVRRYLNENRFRIVEEDTIEDGERKFYHIMIAKSGLTEKYTDLEIEFGKRSRRQQENIKDFKKYLHNRVKKLKQIRKNLDSKNIEKTREIQKKIEEYQTYIGKV